MAGLGVLRYLRKNPLLERLDLVVGLTPDVDTQLLIVAPKELDSLKKSLLVGIGPEIGVVLCRFDG